MAQTAADILIESLHDWGVEVVFGLPRRRHQRHLGSAPPPPGQIRFIQVRHEESAAFMASGYAKYNRQIGRLLGHLGTRRYSPTERSL